MPAACAMPISAPMWVLRREVVRDGVTDVDGDGGGAVAVEHRPQHPFDFGVGVVPRHRGVAVAGADHRLAQPVGIGVQVAERGALGAEMALRPDVVGIAAHVGDLAAAIGADSQSAHRLTQRTCHRGGTGHLSRLGDHPGKARAGAAQDRLHYRCANGSWTTALPKD